MHLDFADTFLIVGMIFSFLINIYFAVEIIKSKISNNQKALWIIAFIVFHTISAVFYLFKREEILSFNKN